MSTQISEVKLRIIILNILVMEVSKGPKSPELVEVVASGCNCMFYYRLSESSSGDTVCTLPLR